jgi:hypothetical protein
MTIANCDELFLRYFGPWLSEQDRVRRVYDATRPDVEHLSCPADLAASDISHLGSDGQLRAAEQIQKVFEAASEDWKALLGMEGTPSLKWIAAFDRYFQRGQIQRVIERSDPTRYDNDYIVLCCELGSVLGEVLQSLEGRLSWLYDWPYWESALYDTRTHSRINVFHWAVKKMSEYGVEDDLKGKLEACRTILHERE